jgi:hypothetical protein
LELLIRHLLSFDISSDSHIRELLKSAQATPPMLSGFMLADAVEKLSSKVTNVFVLMEEAEGDVEQSGMGFWCYAQ